MEVCLDDQQQILLRERKVISDQEVAYKVGDLYVAKNILTNQTRQIKVTGILSEGKRVLKG